jgi:membrane dipeptidase
MKFIDLHTDTIPRLYDHPNETLTNNTGMITLDSLKEKGSLATFFSLFFDLGQVEQPFERANEFLAIFKREMNANQDTIIHTRTFDEYLTNKKNNKISAFLTLEGAEAFEGDMDKFAHFVKEGVRLITLTWNYENEVAFPNGSQEGLKKLGFELIEAMNHEKVIIDVSHLSDKGFYDVLETSKKPFTASHSNARFITGHKRNLTDDMMKKLATKGGITGLNFAPQFLSENRENVLIEDFIKHIQHIINIGGENFLALGSDFDGIDENKVIKNFGEMDTFVQILEMAKLKESLIEKVCYLNAENFLREVL